MTVSVANHTLVTVADCWEGVGTPFAGVILQDGHLLKDALFYIQ